MEHKEYPEQEELVLCTVQNIQGTTVFAKLDKYGKTGVIHTSEIAPGRIRNIRDYVVPNKKIVCKVLRLDISREHIDLSLRRVTKKDTQDMINQFKKEQVAIKILEIVLKDKASKIKEAVLEKYENFNDLLEKSLQDISVLNAFMPKVEAEKVAKIVSEKIKSKKISVKINLKITSQDPDGISIIKEALDVKAPGLKISYLGAPNYMITLEEKEYKTANKKLNKIIEDIEIKLKKKAEIEIEEE